MNLELIKEIAKLTDEEKKIAFNLDRLAAQTEFDIITKNAKGAYNNRYANLTAIYDATQEILNKHNLWIEHIVESLTPETFRIKTTLNHVTGLQISSFIDIDRKGKKDTDVGSSFTYNKRYLESALLRLATDDDDDGQKDRITHLVNQHAENDDQKPLLKAFLESKDNKSLNNLEISTNRNKNAIKDAFKDYVKKACLEVQIVQAEKVIPVQAEPKKQESTLRKVYISILECIRPHVDNQKYEKLATILNKNIASEKEKLGEQTAVKMFTEHLNFMTKNSDLENQNYINNFITMLESK